MSETPGDLESSHTGNEFGYTEVVTITTQEAFDAAVEALLEAGTRAGFHWPKGV